MSKKHWQIVKHDSSGTYREGSAETFAIEKAPPEIVHLAVKAAGLIGDGFYGVDLKQTPDGIYVMEVNDNPNVEIGDEDAVLGDELYRRILGEFVRRLEERPVPAAALLPSVADTVVPLPTSAASNGNSTNGHETVPSNVTRLRDTAT